MEEAMAAKAEREFSAFCNTIETSLRHVDAIRGEVELLFAERNVLNSAREQVKSDMARMRADAADVYAQLHTLYGYSEENRRLALAVAQAEQDTAAAREALGLVRQDCADRIAAATAQAREEVDRARADARNDKTRAADTILELQQKMAAMENSHQQHITRIKLEYEQKQARATATTTASDAGPQGSSQMHEIFRKKLLHAKSASDKEIAALRARVAELEKKVATTGRTMGVAPYAKRNG